MEMNGAAKKVGDQIEKFGNKVEHLGDTKLSDVKLGDTQAGQKLQKAADKATDQASDWISDASAKVRSFKSDTVSFIKANPIAFVAGAVALGFVASRIFLSGKSEE